MDILIREIDPVIVSSIDQLAKKRNLSRNEFLKVMLEHIAKNNLMNTSFEQYKYALNKINKAIELNNVRLENLEREFKKLSSLIMIASNITKNEFETYTR